MLKSYLDFEQPIADLEQQVIPKDRITALHVNHGINNDSDKWEEFCAQRFWNNFIY